MMTFAAVSSFLPSIFCPSFLGLGNDGAGGGGGGGGTGEEKLESVVCLQSQLACASFDGDDSAQAVIRTDATKCDQYDMSTFTYSMLYTFSVQG